MAWTPGASTPPDGPVLGVALMQLVADRRLKVQLFPGQNKAQVQAFTAAALTYVR